MMAMQFHELVAVAPLGIIEQLLLSDPPLRPIWPRMSADRHTFLGFDWITQIQKNKREVVPEPELPGTKVLWLSRFPPRTTQVAELQSVFGSLVVIDHHDIPNAQAAARFFHSNHYRAIVAVVPEAVFEQLTEMELPLLRSEATKESDPNRIEFRGASGQGFRHQRFVWYELVVKSRRL